MSLSDNILLDRIAELEAELKKAKSVPWFERQVLNPFKRLWDWWWSSEDRRAAVGILSFFSILSSIIFWGAAGFPTKEYYMAPGSYGDYHIYQEYFLGKDPKVECCRDGIERCIVSLEQYKKAHREYPEYFE